MFSLALQIATDYIDVLYYYIIKLILELML